MNDSGVICIFCKGIWSDDHLCEPVSSRTVFGVVLDTLPDVNSNVRDSDVNKDVGTFEQDVHSVFVELEALLLTKHNDYGPKNISGAPGGPHNGLRVRLYDKIARISNLLFGKNEVVRHESVEDSYKDIANYGVIGLLVERGLWPE